MNLYHCQKVLLKTERRLFDSGKEILDFNCQRTGFHFRLDPHENRTREDRASALCVCCEKSCQFLENGEVRLDFQK